MDAEYTIRDATPTDAAGFARSQIDAWRAAYAGILPAEYLAAMDLERITSTWRRRIADRPPGVHQLAATVDGEVVGWAGFGIAREEVGDGVGEVHALNLGPAWWSRGIGSALFRGAVEGLAALGYRRGYLWVADGNDRAIAFYEGHGWVLDGATKDDDRFAPPLHELRMTADVLG